MYNDPQKENGSRKQPRVHTCSFWACSLAFASSFSSAATFFFSWSISAEALARDFATCIQDLVSLLSSAQLSSLYFCHSSYSAVRMASQML